MTCVTGVSGSGKSSLVNEIPLQASGTGLEQGAVRARQTYGN